jgi:type VI secretion system protein ImpG
MGVVSSRQFRLFATPVMNLYSKRLDPVNFDARKTDQWLPVDRMQPQGHYLWAIDEVHICYKNGKIEKAQASIDSVAFDDDHRQARYGFRRREAGLMLGTRHDVVDPLASHDTISLSLQGTNKSVEEVTTVLVKAWVTDRAWSPKALLDAPLTLQDAHAVARIECLWAGSMPRPVPTMEVCWEAVSCLSANPLAMSRPGRQDITAQIVNYIRQATHADHALDRQRLSSVRSVHIRTGHVRARRHSPMAWVRCMHLDMDFDSAHHADQGAWLFGRVLAQALSEYISLNDGIEVRIFLDGELSSVHSNTHREDGVLE